MPPLSAPPAPAPSAGARRRPRAPKAMQPTGAAEADGRRPRVLCLHGSRQDGELFQQRLAALRKRLGAAVQLVFLSAPHELPLEAGQSVAMRCWCGAAAAAVFSFCTATVAPPGSR